MTENAINFWKSTNDRFPCEEIQKWIAQLESGKGEWFRNYGLAQNAIARHCRFGRIGFNDEKNEQGKAWVREQLTAHGIPTGAMQN